MALNKVLSTPKFWMVERGATGRVAPSPRLMELGLKSLVALESSGFDIIYVSRFGPPKWMVYIICFVFII